MDLHSDPDNFQSILTALFIVIIVYQYTILLLMFLILTVSIIIMCRNIFTKLTEFKWLIYDVEINRTTKNMSKCVFCIIKIYMERNVNLFYNVEMFIDIHKLPNAFFIKKK